MARYTREYSISTGTNDGYVNHTLSTFNNDSNSLLLYWNFWEDNGLCDFFVGFNSVSIPKNSNIIRATLRLNVFKVDTGWVQTELKASLGNDAPTDYSEFTALVGTDEYINIYLDPNDEEQIIQHDITDLIQEKINQMNWVDGNNIIFFTENTAGETGASGADFDSFEYNPIAKLVIVYEPPAVITLEDILTGSRVESFKYELLTLQSGKYKHYDWITNNIESGNIKVDFANNVICSINLKMLDNESINYLSDLIRPWYCVSYNGIDYNFPLGTYMLISPTKDSDGMIVSRNITGHDLLYALEQDKITASTFYEKGDNVTDAIKALLDTVGEWVEYSIPDSDEVLAEDMSYEIGKSKLFIINSLLSTINYYPLWATGNGVYKSVLWSDNQAITWTFKDNESSLYESGIKLSIDYSQIYNKVVVVANQLTADTEALIKIWTFEDEGLDSHPLSYTSLGRYIVKTFDSEAVSQDYVDLRARRELLKMLEIEEGIEYKHAFVSGRFIDGLPYHGDCYRFINTLLGLDSTYKIQSQSYNLNVGSSVNSVIRRVTGV
jgi:hypothetical protein